MEKTELHARNRHRARYDYPALIASSPELGSFVAKNKFGDLAVDFADPAAVKVLNRALLKHFYRIVEWDVPAGYLCPPIPGRADYLHHAADVLAKTNGGTIPRGESVHVLDVGTGANAVYPLLGNREYGWSFVGTEIDAVALAAANRNIERNPDLAGAVEFRLQKDPARIFDGIIGDEERFDLVICNPPFHESAEEAAAGSARKWKNLGKGAPGGVPPKLNFGGTNRELWCEGGERAFIARMIDESKRYGDRVRWFTALVAKENHLEFLIGALTRAKVKSQSTIGMSQGQKKSRILVWTFAK